jgi:LacI family transcriptional regulator
LGLLGSRQRPTAIIAGGTAMLAGVLHAVRELGLAVPRDISVIAGADSDLARFAEPPITVIRWDHDGLGRTAGRFLINRLSDPGHPRQRQIFPTELVVRGSCAAPSSIN